MKKKHIILLFSIMLLHSCTTNKNESIVLKIGKLEISKYEYKKNKERENNSDDNSKTKQKNVSSWKKEYLNRCFIIADGYDKQFDTLTHIKKEILHMSKFMMVQQYGYLWKKTVAPSVDSCRQLTDKKIEKRKKLFYFDYVSCNGLENLLKITNNDTLIQNSNDFNQLKNRCHSNNFLQGGYISLQWPFLSMWKYRDYIYNLKEGQISRPLEANGNYYYLYLDQIETVDIKQKDKESLQTELQLGIQKETGDNKIKEMNRKGNLNIYDVNINELLSFILSGHTISDFKNNIELFHYDIEKSMQSIDFNTFLEYYSFLPMKPPVENKENLIDLINQYYYDDYLNREAEKLGLYDVDTFMLDQKNFKNNIIFNEYVNRVIVPEIKVDSLEITVYYTANKMDYIQPKNVTIDLFIFDKLDDAYQSIPLITDFENKNKIDKTIDTKIFTGLKECKLDYKIDRESPDNYPDEFINELLSAKTSTSIKKPIEFQNSFIVFHKNTEDGQCFKKLKDMSTQIENHLKIEKMNAKICELTQDLRKKYKIEIDRTGIE
jgi:hypothetical protein